MFAGVEVRKMKGDGSTMDRDKICYSAKPVASKRSLWEATRWTRLFEMIEVDFWAPGPKLLTDNHMLHGD